MKYKNPCVLFIHPEDTKERKRETGSLIEVASAVWNITVVA